MRYSKKTNPYAAHLPEVFEITMSLVDDPGPKPDTELDSEDINALTELLRSAPTEMDEKIVKQRDELYEFDPRFRLQREQVAALSPQLALALDRRPDVAVAFWQSFRKLPQWATEHAESINWKFIYRVLSRCLIVDANLQGYISTATLTNDTPVTSISDRSLNHIATEYYSIETRHASSSNTLRINSYEAWVGAAVPEENTPEFKAGVASTIPGILDNSIDYRAHMRLPPIPAPQTKGLLAEHENLFVKRHTPHYAQRRVFSLLLEAVAEARPGDYIYLRNSMEERIFGDDRYRPSPPITSALVNTIASMNASGKLNDVIPVHPDIAPAYKNLTGFEILRELVHPQSASKNTPVYKKLPTLVVDRPNISIFGKTDGIEMQDQAPLVPMPIVWVGTGGLLASVDVYRPMFIGPSASLKILDGNFAAPFHLSEKSTLTLVDCAVESIFPEGANQDMDLEDEETFLHLPPNSTDYHLHFQHVEVIARLKLPQIISLYQKLQALPVQDVKLAFEAEKRRQQKEMSGSGDDSDDTTDHLVPPLPSDPVIHTNPDYAKHMQFLRTITTLLGNEIFDDQLTPAERELSDSIVPNGFGNAIRLQLVQWLYVMQDDPKFVSMTLASLRFIPDQLVFNEAKQMGIIPMLHPILRRHIDDDVVPATVFAVITKLARAASIPTLIPLLRSPEMWQCIHTIMGKIQGWVGKDSTSFLSELESASSASSSDANILRLVSDIKKIKLSGSSQLTKSVESADFTDLKSSATVSESDRSKIYKSPNSINALTNALSALTFAPELAVFIYEECLDFLFWCIDEFIDMPAIMENITAIFDGTCRILESNPKYGSEVTIKLVKRGCLRPSLVALKGAPLSSMIETVSSLMVSVTSIAPEEVLAYLKETRVEKVKWRDIAALGGEYRPLKEPQCLFECKEEDEDGLRLILRAVALRGEENAKQPMLLDRFHYLIPLLNLDDDYWTRTRIAFEDELLTTRLKETQNISFIAVLAHLISLSSKTEHLVYLANSGFLQFIEGCTARGLTDAEIQMAAIVNLAKCDVVLREKAILLKSCALHIQGNHTAEYLVDWANTVVDKCKPILEGEVVDQNAHPEQDGTEAANADEEANEEEDGEVEEEDQSFAELRAGAKLIPAPGVVATDRYSISSNGLTVRYDGAEWTSFILELPEDEWLTSGKWCYEVVFNSAGPMQIGWASPNFAHRSDQLLGVGDDKYSCAIDLERLALWHVPEGQEGVRDFFALNDAFEQWQRGSALVCCADLDNLEFMWAMDGQIRGQLKMDSLPEGGLRPAFTFGWGESISLNLGAANPIVEWKALNRGFTPLCEPRVPFTRDQSKERALELGDRRLAGPGYIANDAMNNFGGNFGGGNGAFGNGPFGNGPFGNGAFGNGGDALGGLAAGLNGLNGMNLANLDNLRLGANGGNGFGVLGPPRPGPNVGPFAAFAGPNGIVVQPGVAPLAPGAAPAGFGLPQGAPGDGNNPANINADDLLARLGGLGNNGFGNNGFGNNNRFNRGRHQVMDEEDEEFDPALLNDIEVEDDRENVHEADFDDDMMNDDMEEDEEEDGDYDEYY